MAKFRSEDLTVATLIRGRTEHLPYFLYNLSRQEYTPNGSKQRIRSHLYVNFTDDEEADADKIAAIAQMANKKLLPVSLFYQKVPNLKKDSRQGNRLEIYGHLAEMRNNQKKKIAGNPVMFLDSDIMLRNTCSLQTLFNAFALQDDHCAGISLLIDNGHGTSNAMVFDKENSRYVHLGFNPNTGMRECDLTGAAFMLKEEAYRYNDYAFSPIGEDEPFCRSLKRKGYAIFQYTNVVGIHCMNLEQLDNFKAANPQMQIDVERIFRSVL